MMDEVKVVSVLVAVWGFLPYIYQDYVDDMIEETFRNDAKDTSGSNEGEHGTPCPPEAVAIYDQPKQWRCWWLLVSINILFILAGQSAGVLLGRFYFDKGGDSKWLATLVLSAGFPLLIPILLLFTLNKKTPTIPQTQSSWLKIASVYTALGLMLAGDNLMYIYGLMLLPVSTYSLICATQLAFNAVFSYFINSQKLTHLILNSVILLTFSASLLGIPSDSTTVAHENYAVGFALTVCASAAFSLILSLMQLTFQKMLKRETFSVVLEMHVCTNIVATGVTVVGLFASGEWKTLHAEMKGFGTGSVSYVMTLIGTAISWQVAAVGIVGSVYLVSSLFSSVMSTVALPVTPILAVICFHDKMDGVKVVSMLIAIWGFLSYIYQHYLDDLSEKEAKRDQVL